MLVILYNETMKMQPLRAHTENVLDFLLFSAVLLSRHWQLRLRQGGALRMRIHVISYLLLLAMEGVLLVQWFVGLLSLFGCAGVAEKMYSVGRKRKTAGNELSASKFWRYNVLKHIGRELESPVHKHNATLVFSMTSQNPDSKHITTEVPK